MLVLQEVHARCHIHIRCTLTEKKPNKNASVCEQELKQCSLLQALRVRFQRVSAMVLSARSKETLYETDASWRDPRSRFRPR